MKLIINKWKTLKQKFYWTRYSFVPAFTALTAPEGKQLKYVWVHLRNKRLSDNT